MRSLGLALAVVLLWAGGAQARREQTYAYPYVSVWTAAIRMLRVDFESPITEKDKDSGYFLFEYPDSGKAYPGSVEVVRSSARGRETARVVVQIPAMPSYVEQMLLDHLTRKLAEDYGQPVAPKPAPAPGEAEPPPDSAAPGDDGTPAPGQPKQQAKPAPQPSQSAPK